MGSQKTRRSLQAPSTRSLSFAGGAAFVTACGNLIVQLDTHPVGAAMFIGIVALVFAASLLMRRGVS